MLHSFFPIRKRRFGYFINADGSFQTSAHCFTLIFYHKNSVFSSPLEGFFKNFTKPSSSVHIATFRRPIPPLGERLAKLSTKRLCAAVCLRFALPLVHIFRLFSPFHTFIPRKILWTSQKTNVCLGINYKKFPVFR